VRKAGNPKQDWQDFFQDLQDKPGNFIRRQTFLVHPEKHL
jgi:hypothetical protein